MAHIVQWPSKKRPSDFEWSLYGIDGFNSEEQNFRSPKRVTDWVSCAKPFVRFVDVLLHIKKDI